MWNVSFSGCREKKSRKSCAGDSRFRMEGRVEKGLQWRESVKGWWGATALLLPCFADGSYTLWGHSCSPCHSLTFASCTHTACSHTSPCRNTAEQVCRDILLKGLEDQSAFPSFASLSRINGKDHELYQATVSSVISPSGKQWSAGTTIGFLRTSYARQIYFIFWIVYLKDRLEGMP